MDFYTRRKLLCAANESIRAEFTKQERALLTRAEKGTRLRRSGVYRMRSSEGTPVMTSFHQFGIFAASRGEGLHPKLRALLERTAASPFSDVAATVDFGHIKRHYYQNHRKLNPSGIVPVGPELAFMSRASAERLSAKL